MKKLVRLRWNRSTDIDVTHGGRVYVRHSPLTNGNGTFSNSTDLIQALSWCYHICGSSIS